MYPINCPIFITIVPVGFHVRSHTLTSPSENIIPLYQEVKQKNMKEFYYLNEMEKRFIINPY
jgi:hypothetical protein